MRKSLFIWVVLLLATFPVVAQQPLKAAVSLPIGYAMVDAAKGEVVLHSAKGEPLPAQRGQILPAESTIETAKGSILLDLQDGSQVLVKPNSRIVLKAPPQDKGSYLELLLGKVLSKIEKRLNNAPSFRMGTPSAVITVRGTRFLVEVNKKQRTTIEVYEGVVEVQGIGAGASAPPVILRPGFTTDVEPDGAPHGPRQFGPEPMERPEPGESRGEAGGHSGQPMGREAGEGHQPSPSSSEPD